MSAILSNDDLNDFISPGVACIKPVEVQKSQDHAEIEIGKDGEAYEVSLDGSESTKQKQKLDEAQINLSDCLACSGCITSAESVLVSMQSHKQVLESLENDLDKKIFVASISPQARASLANAFGVSIQVADRRLWWYLNKLGFKNMVGTEVGRAISLEMGAQEAMNRKCTISSVCPGWTCYVEKTHPHMIPYMSNVKSPQQITGMLLKQLVQKKYNKDVYHLSIMPCFDKKLEASRPEFENEVDCVITTKEIVQLLYDQELDFNTLGELELPSLENYPSQHMLSNPGSSSGGYVDYYLSSIKSKTPGSRVITTPGRNPDIVEYGVVTEDNKKPVAKAARIYGFRNIQNLVRKLKRNKIDYDYIEVMACPGGCINGGGQISNAADVSSKEWKIKVDELYESIEKVSVDNGLVDRFVEQLGGNEMDFNCTFKAVEESNLPKALTVGTTW